MRLATLIQSTEHLVRAFEATSKSQQELVCGTEQRELASAQDQTHGAGEKSEKAKDKKDRHACKGQNSCKGKGACKGGDNGCKGQNSCKGKGGCRTDGKPMDEKPS